MKADELPVEVADLEDGDLARRAIALEDAMAAARIADSMLTMYAAEKGRLDDPMKLQVRNVLLGARERLLAARDVFADASPWLAAWVSAGAARLETFRRAGAAGDTYVPDLAPAGSKAMDVELPYHAAVADLDEILAKISDAVFDGPLAEARQREYDREGA